MEKFSCCGDRSGSTENYEVARIRKTEASCRVCDDYADRQKTKPVAVMCCEGACLRGEVARQAANTLCHVLAPEKTARICLGGAFTKDTGQRDLVRQASKVIAVEGCGISCASRMMQGVMDGLKPEIVYADRLYDFDRSLFGADQMPPEEIAAHGRTVAEKLMKSL